MHCPHCGAESVDRNFCRACGLNLTEFSPLLADKQPKREERKLKKRKSQRLRLRVWTGVGIVFYITLYWIIISEVIIGKGKKFGGILFLLVITAISVGGLLILYSAALARRSAHAVLDPPDEKRDIDLGSQTLELPTRVTEITTELPVKDLKNGR